LLSVGITGVIGSGVSSLFDRIAYDEFKQSTCYIPGFDPRDDGLDHPVVVDDVQYVLRLTDTRRPLYIDEVWGKLDETSKRIESFDILVITFDVTKEDSFDKCDEMLNEFLKRNPKDHRLAIVIAETKIDLVDERKITHDKVRDYYSCWNPPIKCFETSSKTGQGVTEAFENAVRIWNETNNDNETEQEDKSKCIIV